ncbi:CASP-like protein 4D1 [Morus notabilis]|uniref:CASP-like protein 4D1 n=1 Tax=Morus notabilis TaxID=981085 RepID=UPI000CECF1B4|nr:CASP-like protein 4D1 [Morus notabilis]
MQIHGCGDRPRHCIRTLAVCILNPQGSKRRRGKLLFDFYGEKIMSYMLASGAAAGLAVTVNYQNNFDSLKVFSEFYEKAYASSSILLLAFVLAAALSVISTYALPKKECETSG